MAISNLRMVMVHVQLLNCAQTMPGGQLIDTGP